MKQTSSSDQKWKETEWTIPAARYKTKIDHLIPLSMAASALIDTGPSNDLGISSQSAEAKSNGFIFTLNGRQAIGGLTRHKQAVDEVSGVMGWTIHDLRRTARSLMSRAGVNADIAERSLGHVIGGVRGIYDGVWATCRTDRPFMNPRLT
jgi:integrase